MNYITLFGIFSPGVFTLVTVLTIFSWFYPARIIRSQVLSLREKEFVEAARMVGASNFRIMRSHLLPHLAGTSSCTASITVAINILAESTLSFLGVGLPDPNASWGKLLDTAVAYLHDPAVADPLARSGTADRGALRSISSATASATRSILAPTCSRSPFLTFA